MRLESGRDFVLETAVTGRSLCRGCRAKIARGSPRFGARTEPLVDRIDWFHPHCVRRWPLALVELAERWPDPLPGLERSTRLLSARYDRPPPDLDALERASTTGDRDALMTGLRDLWQATRDPLPAELLARCTHLEIARSPIPAQGAPAWATTLDPADARRNGHRIVARLRGTKDQVASALTQAREEPADPRWLEPLLQWLAVPPWSNPFWIWTEVVTLFDHFADPRLLSAAAAIAAMPPHSRAERYGGISARILGRWAEARVRHGFPAITAPRHALSDADRARLDRISHALDRRESDRASEQRTRADLFHAAAAGDDTALLVLADALIADGDVLGELIQLELAGRDRTPAQRQRRASLKKQWRILLGDLAPALLRDGLRFRRGLVVSATATAVPPADLQRAVRSPRWASVERLELRRDPAGAIPAQLVFAPHARRLRSVRLPDVDALYAVCGLDGVAPAVTELELASGAWHDWPRRDAVSRRMFPALERIRVPDAIVAASIVAMTGDVPIVMG